MPSSPEDIAFDRAYVQAYGLYGFLKLAWPRLRPGIPFVDGPHIRQVCNHLEAASLGLITRLVINVPPGTGKSITAGVCWPAYTWGPMGMPEKKWIFAGYSPALSGRDAREARELIESEWYQERWPVQILDRADTDYRNAKRGWRFSTSIRGPVTGRHADIQVVDDPIKPIQASGAAAITGHELEFVKSWWGGTMSTRMANPKTCVRVIIMQRLHEEDLAGHCLESGEYVHLCLPMRFDPEHVCRTGFGGDWRTHEGELLCPERFGEKEVLGLERDLGVFASAQLDQRPARAGGQIFHEAWLRYWTADMFPVGVNPLTGEGFDELVSSWDFTFKDTLGSDFVCGQVWARLGADLFMLDRIYERLNLPNSLTAIQAQCRRWPHIGAKLVEDKANGPAVIATLERKIPGLIAREPLGSKVTRANAVSYMHRAGNIYYRPIDLAERKAKIPNGHVKAIVGFPLAKFDDTVDSETQALAYFEEQHNTLFAAIEAMNKQRAIRVQPAHAAA